MIRLPEVLDAWETAAFDRVLKQALGDLDPDLLPLQQALQRGSHVSAEPPTVMVVSRHASGEGLQVKVAICYSSVIAGCNCADDPTPTDETLPEYCELQLDIDRVSAETRVTLLPA